MFTCFIVELWSFIVVRDEKTLFEFSWANFFLIENFLFWWPKMTKKIQTNKKKILEFFFLNSPLKFENWQVQFVFPSAFPLNKVQLVRKKLKKSFKSKNYYLWCWAHSTSKNYYFFFQEIGQLNIWLLVKISIFCHFWW